MATKPLLKNGIRITTKGKPTGKQGRPKGTRKKRHFDETKLGFFLKYEAPIEYELIMASTPKGVFPEPTIKIIEAITLALTQSSKKINSIGIWTSTKRTSSVLPSQNE